MIWFACEQCGKLHSREDLSAGTLVFCECGQGNRVPWTSTVAEPQPHQALPVPSPQLSAPRRSRNRSRPNPAYCLHHPETPKEATCAACGCSFCSACVVLVQGQTLCGPCKNFRLGSVGRTTPLPLLAILSFVLALGGTFVCLMLNFLAIGLAIRNESGFMASILCCTLALVFAVGELIISGLALRQIERRSWWSGRGLATTGAIAGLTGMVWSLTLMLFIVVRHIQG